jgi:hypothetical protein
MKIRRVEQRLPYAEARLRALSALDVRIPSLASSVAAVIWPETRFRSKQGAGFAAIGILKRMEHEGLVRWCRLDDQIHGYIKVLESEPEQEERELQEALRVLKSNDASESMEIWDGLQRWINDLYADMPSELPAARSFASMQEKNAYDEEREVRFALEFQKSHAHRQS